MQNYNINDLVKFAGTLADASGIVIRKYYRNFGAVESKGDSSPVTIADKETELAIRRIIKENYPSHGIQGEEFGLENSNAKLRWIIDPIDGTTSFMIGRPIFGTLISLAYEGKPIIGIINQPITNERWIGAEGRKTIFHYCHPMRNEGYFNAKDSTSLAKNDNAKAVEIHVRQCLDLSKAVLCTSGPQYFNAEKLKKFNALAGKVMSTVYGGDCYNFGLVAMGQVDAVVESGLKPHDFMALVAVVEGAGGIATDWQGKPLNIDSGGDVVFCGDKKIHSEILEMLK